MPTAATRMSAEEFIDARVVLEAKRLLAHGEDPVARIADRLGFDDASNFVKYFALRAGTTPAAFRHRYRVAGNAPAAEDDHAGGSRPATRRGGECLRRHS